MRKKGRERRKEEKKEDTQRPKTHNGEKNITRTKKKT